MCFNYFDESTHLTRFECSGVKHLHGKVYLGKHLSFVDSHNGVKWRAKSLLLLQNAFVVPVPVFWLFQFPNY